MEVAMTAPDPVSHRPAVSPWLWAALLVALLASAGSVGLSLGLGLKACPLCFYQRAFAMSVFAVLGTGLLAGATARLGLLALPLATAGLGVALFHVSLEVRDILECPRGLLGLGTAPQQSLVMFGLLFALLVLDVMRTAREAVAVGAIVLGTLLAVGCSTSNPPLPEPPQKAYASPDPDICRRPYRP
jgi:hypothetical protein